MPKTVPESRAAANLPQRTSLGAAFRKEVSRRVSGGNFAERERVALEVANELVREELIATLNAIVTSQGTGDLSVDGVRYRWHAEGSAKYHSLVGPLEIKRPSFRKADERNGSTCIPLELAAGLVERATPALAERVAMGHGDGPSRDLHQQLLASHRVPPSRSTLQVMGTRIGTALDQHTAQLETCARGAEKLPPEAVTICVGLDRTSAPMEETLPEDAPRRERVKPRVRKAPPPVTVNYRMAYVGTVSLVDAGGEVIQTYKYAATAEDGPQQVLHSMMQDVRRALRQDRSLRVIVVQDAAREMWNLVVEALHAEPSVDHWDELIDHHHGTAHMWKAASAMAANTNGIMERWLGDLRRSDDAIERIAAELDVERQLGYHPTFRIILEDELTFITNNGARLRYASLRDAGFPIGSGPTEGAGKSFFSIRCKRSGQRWRNPGLAAVLASRSHLLNGRLSAVMRNLRKRFYTAQIEMLPRAA